MGPPGEIRGGFHLQDHGWHLVRRAPFKSADRHEVLALIMHAVGEANVLVLPTVFRSKALDKSPCRRTVLTFLRRPTIRFGARAAHQHRSLSVAQAVSLEEGLDGLLIVDDG